MRPDRWGDAIRVAPAGELALVFEHSRNSVTGAEEPTRQRALGHAESSRRFRVGETGDVDRDKRVAELLRQLGDRREHPAFLGGIRRVVTLARPERGVVDQFCREGRRLSARRWLMSVLRKARIR